MRCTIAASLQMSDEPKKSISFTHNTHCINELRVKVKGEGKNFELAECAMRRGVSVRA